MSHAENKSERLLQIEALLLAHPEGLTQAEIARRMGVNRSTIHRCLPGLERFCIYETDDGRLAIDRDHYLMNIKLTLHESMALHVAARLMATRTDKQNPHAAAALRKLGLALEKLAPFVSQHILASADVMDSLARRHDPVYLDVLETLTRAWSLQRKVWLKHQTPDQSVFEYTFSPYFVEPYAVGQTTHVIGWREPPGALRTFKLERIKAIGLLDEAYTIPADFDPRALLADAWGVWYTEAEPVEVVLRFHPNAAARIRETRWHRSQHIEEQPDGFLLWRAQVAEPQEMIPWIQGWGADVEVLDPKGLRDTLVSEARSLAVQYKISNTTQPPAYYLLWAKADRKTGDYHLLPYHLIDVGQVALTLWQTGLNDSLRRQIADWLGLDVDAAGRLIAFWTSLHDVGKASPAFQDHPKMPNKLKAKIQRELPAAGLTLSQQSGGETRARHETVSTGALKAEGWLTAPAPLTELVAQGLGGHHGAWPLSTALTRLDATNTGDAAWLTARQALGQEMARIFQPPTVAHFEPDTLKDNIMLTLVSGLVAAADWLGSDEDNFPYEKEPLPLDAYARHALQHARYALLRAEWKKAPPMPPFDFERAFGFPHRKAQQQVSAALNGVALPALAIIEAPMGSGKTEAALAVYAQWAQAAGAAGLYVAMPTTATSNQMHARVTDFLSAQFDRDVEPLLVHSHALLRDAPAASDTVEEDEGERAGAQAWFLPRKKSLLAPFGVGTVDQALMSVLQTKHFFVRLLGLDHKIVIFDEVHAYDAYMSELFERLLAWLRQIDASVIVLSATLPAKTRQRLVQAYAGNAAIPPAKDYPRLTFAASDGTVDAIELDQPAEKTLQFEWIERDEDAIIERLAAELREGGCAVVICNTVRRAQQLYEALRRREEKLCDDDSMVLFHARFPMAWRDELERDVLKKFGPGKDKAKPNPDRPTKAIVVATQVVEQSLDLDFDVMISDHAPLDLLLQRAGRFHRHKANDPRKRPYRLLIARPEFDSKGVPQFTRRDVYAEYVLLRSWIALDKLAPQQIVLPADLPALIEQVYGDAEPSAEPDLLAALAAAKDEMTKDELKVKVKARKRRIAKPDHEDLLWGDNAALEEDDPAVHETLQALTRADRPGISVVCLHRIDGKLLLEPDDPSTVYDPTEKLEKAMMRELARHTVSVRHFDPAVEMALLAEPDDAQIKEILIKWKKAAALRYHRAAIFENGVCCLKGTGYVMRLNKQDKLGLRIEEEV